VALKRCLILSAVVGALAAGSVDVATAAIYELSQDPRAEMPDIAVGDDGTAHVVWNLHLDIPGDDQLVYCRVPKGAKACAATNVFTLPLTDFDGPQVILTGSGQVVLVSNR
jgi:hypothetical protein